MTDLAMLNPLGRDALILRRTRIAIEAVLAIGLMSAGAITLSRLVESSQPWWLAVVAVAALDGFRWWWVGIDHSRWAWRLDEDLFEVRHGVLIHRTHLVPRNRIQNVTTTAGPLQNRFGVVSLTVHTAGARTRNVSIENLDVGHAQAIRRRLGLA